MSERVCIITGPTHGIGRAAAKALSKLGYRLILACRNETLGTALQAELAGPSTVVRCDLADLDSVAEFCERVGSEVERIDVLANNAGIMTTDGRRVGPYDAMMAVNHLGHFLLTTRLLDLITATPDSRIVNVASRAHARARLSVDDPLATKTPASGMNAYGQSKLANVLFTLALARRLADTTTCCNALHPGVVATNIMSRAGGWLRLLAPVVKPLMLSEERGAETLVYLASSGDAAGLRGCYLDEHQRVLAPSRIAQDEELQESLWRASAAAVATP